MQVAPLMLSFLCIFIGKSKWKCLDSFKVPEFSSQVSGFYLGLQWSTKQKVTSQKARILVASYSEFLVHIERQFWVKVLRVFYASSVMIQLFGRTWRLKQQRNIVLHIFRSSINYLFLETQFELSFAKERFVVVANLILQGSVTWK